MTYACLLVCQTIFLALRSVNPVIKTRASVASDAIGLVGVIGAGLLSWFDHRRSIRPSTVLALYLSIVALLDLARLRTLWSIAGVTGAASVFTLAFVLKCVALTIESISKQRSLQSASDYLGVGSEPFSGLWMRTTYVWLLGTVQQGYRHILSVDDLPAIEPKLRSHVLHEQLEKEWAASDRMKKNGLLLTCFRTYSISFLSAVLPRLCLSGFTFAQPFMVNTLTTWIQDKDAPNSSGKAMIGAYALVYVGMATSTAIYWYQSYRFLIRLRGGLIALVYRRTVETRAVDLGEITGLTLMGTDVERILVGFRSIHEVWASLLEMIISLYLLERQLQVACLLPGVLTLIFSLTTFKLSSWGNDAQKKWIERVEERLSVTSSMLGDMKAVKMLGLTDRMFDIIDRLQRIEVETSKRFRKNLIAQVFFSNSPAALAPVATFAFYVGISRAQANDSILASRAFTSLALISLLTASALTFIQSIPSMVQCFACFGRIQEFCRHTSGASEYPDAKSAALVNAVDSTSMEMHDVKKMAEREQSSVLVSFTNQSFAWKAGGEPCLKSLNFDIHARKVTAIIGPTASGKSTLMHSIVRETCALEGQTLRRFETAAYCSQVPWLTNDTIRSNIIGALPMEELWYASVLHACALEEDIAGMARGDQTKVGNNGAGLSGGQRQRVTLARALYSRCKVVLLDDTFSGLDAHTVEVIAGRVFGPRGLFARNQVSVIVATHSAAIIPFADDIVVLQDGTVTQTGSSQSLAQSLEDLPISTITQTGTPEGASAEPSAEQVETEKSSAEQDAIDALDPKRQQGDWSVYSYYFKAAGRREVVFFLLFMILWTVCEQFSSVWLNWWSNANEIEPHAREGMYLGVYAGLGVAASAFMSAACWILFVDMITKSMRALHRGLLTATLHAPLYFFHKTDIGSITNRFSQDMELIGLDFPLVAINYVSAACNCVAQVLILGIYTKYLAVTVPFVLILVVLIQRFYLRTSRQIRLLDIEAKAPVFSHFIETNTGAATIRAFGWQTYFGQRLESVLDRSQRPVYLLLSVQRWLAVLLDLIVSILAVLLVSIIVTWKSAFDPGAVGLSLVLVMTFNKTLMSVVRFWTMLETSIGAVSRVQKYVKGTASETHEDASSKPVPGNWPAAGAIRFIDLVVSHMPDGPPVLKNLSLDIKAGEKIAICGRSGSGKSSLILSLLRMTMLQDGLVEVDGVDVSSVPLVELRQLINVVPQDPALMPGTVRFNLDPYFSATDHDIIKALERLQLWERIERAGGLDAKFESASWSVGERQLLCLARAMVRKSKVLVLDEATSSVDQQTESLMQDAIKTWFSDCTVLSVLHRLDGIRSFDKVAVLHDGVVAEFGSPDQLLEVDSRLQAFYRAGGYYN